MQDFSNNLALVPALALGDGVENVVRKLGNFGSEVEEIPRHELAPVLVRDLLTAWLTRWVLIRIESQRPASQSLKPGRIERRHEVGFLPLGDGGFCDTEGAGDA